MTRVLLVDDQPEIRQALRTIASSAGHEVVGEAEDGAQAVRLAGTRAPEVILMDVRMPRMDGLTATRRVMTQPDAPAVIVLTTYDLDAYVFGALQAGAAGFLLKSSAPEQILAGVREAAAGRGLIAPEVTRRLIAAFAQAMPARAGDPALSSLTPREREVLEALARGLTNADIARRLVVEETTVKSHVRAVLTKLDLRSRAQAVIFAYESGIVTPGPR